MTAPETQCSRPSGVASCCRLTCKPKQIQPRPQYLPENRRTLEPGCLPQSKQITDRFRPSLISVWLYLRGDECLVAGLRVRRCETVYHSDQIQGQTGSVTAGSSCVTGHSVSVARVRVALHHRPLVLAHADHHLKTLIGFRRISFYPNPANGIGSDHPDQQIHPDRS